MSTTVCLAADTLYYPEGGGHQWVSLNWALGLKGLGCRVVWLEGVSARLPPDRTRACVATLDRRLGEYGLAGCLALRPKAGGLPRDLAAAYPGLDAAAEADLLLNPQYDLGPDVVGRFRRTALLDIDPGLLQLWMTAGVIRPARHDVYFTTGETVGRPGSRVPAAGLEWRYVPPCVALDWWPPCPAAGDAPFTTVSHWSMNEWVEDGGEVYANDKRAGFLPFLDLPRHTCQPLELALFLAEGEGHERAMLEGHGWRVRKSDEVAASPRDYQRYVQGSRGEFSCAKPSCVRLANAWVSDRTLCYLASGRPAVVQHTGPSRFLPDAAGLFRFRDLAGAARGLEAVAADYDRQCRLARALAEEFFDARKVARRVLEQALA
jgi:hypothetical protein